MYKGKIPFDKITGSLISEPYIDTSERDTEGRYEWKDNYIFEKELLLYGYGGRYLVDPSTIVITNNDYIDWGRSRHYRAFSTDLSNIIKYSTIRNGYVSNTWTFCKRGYKYGITLANVDIN